MATKQEGGACLVMSLSTGPLVRQALHSPLPCVMTGKGIVFKGADTPHAPSVESRTKEAIWELRPNPTNSSREADGAALQADLEAVGGTAAILQHPAPESAGAIPSAFFPTATTLCQGFPAVPSAACLQAAPAAHTVQGERAEGDELTEEAGEGTVGTAVCGRREKEEDG